MLRHKFILGLIFFFCGAISFADDAFVARDEVQQFMSSMVSQYAFDQEALTALFSQIQLNEVVLKTKHSHDYHPRPWYQYRNIFLTKKNVQRGIDYWQEQEHVLKRVQKKYAVPADVIVGIVGVETKYGLYEGSYSVLNSLSSFAFNYPSRAVFFKYELEQFLLMCRKYHFDPLAVKGSYAGAMGKLQFMPHAVMQYAVQFDALKPLDLNDNDADVIASIANYLKLHGWKKGFKIAEQVSSFDYGKKQIPEIGAKPSQTTAGFEKMHIRSINPLENKPLFKFKMQGEHEAQYWFGYYNLYVLSRYNRNLRYGLTVKALGEAVQRNET